MPFHHNTVNVTETGIHIDDVRADAPEFKRIYSAKLNERATIKITAESTIVGRLMSGELDQPNGRWVLFDTDAIADKILDRELVPLIQSYVDQIKALDGAYIASKPAEFTDEDGVKWHRVQ